MSISNRLEHFVKYAANRDRFVQIQHMHTYQWKHFETAKINRKQIQYDVITLHSLHEAGHTYHALRTVKVDTTL